MSFKNKINRTEPLFRIINIFFGDSARKCGFLEGSEYKRINNLIKSDREI